MLGDSIAGVKTTLKTIVHDEDKLGSTEAEREISLTSLAAIWKMCSSLQDHFAARRAKMEEDPSKVPEIPGDHHAEFREQFVIRRPDVLLPPHREPHRKFVERIQRDYMFHGAVPFYQVGEMRTRSEQIVQKSGISKTAEDLIKVVNVDQPAQAASETQVIDKLHAFFVALEYLNICEFSTVAGPLRYISEIEEWRHENKGLARLLAVDTLIRKKVYRLNYDQRKQFATFSAALVEVLTNHKQLWNDARSNAELDKFKQAGQQAPETPVCGTKRSISDEESTTKKPSARAKKNKARRERQKALLQKAKSTTSDRKDAGSKPRRMLVCQRKNGRGSLHSSYSGKRRCPFFNCSSGCRFGDSCRNAHLCVECGIRPPLAREPLSSQHPQASRELARPGGSISAVDPPLTKLRTQTAQRPVWKSWDEVPRDVDEVARHGPWFLEIFSGTARLTAAVRALGVPCLPPIDITVCQEVPSPWRSSSSSFRQVS